MYYDIHNLFQKCQVTQFYSTHVPITLSFDQKGVYCPNQEFTFLGWFNSAFMAGIIYSRGTQYKSFSHHVEKLDLIVKISVLLTRIMNIQEGVPLINLKLVMKCDQLKCHVYIQYSYMNRASITRKVCKMYSWGQDT